MAAAAPGTRSPRLSATLRKEETVTPLELFFDLVFVLAITQCTALMAEDRPAAGVLPYPRARGSGQDDRVQSP